MSKRFFIILVLFLLVCLLLCSCEGHACIHYQASASNFDPDNLNIYLNPNEQLSHSHPYDVEITDNGYDIILHIVNDQNGTKTEDKN